MKILEKTQAIKAVLKSHPKPNRRWLEDRIAHMIGMFTEEIAKCAIHGYRVTKCGAGFEDCTPAKYIRDLKKIAERDWKNGDCLQWAEDCGIAIYQNDDGKTEWYAVKL